MYQNKPESLVYMIENYSVGDGEIVSASDHPMHAIDTFLMSLGKVSKTTKEEEKSEPAVHFFSSFFWKPSLNRKLFKNIYHQSFQ